MKITYAMTTASVLLFAAGCAHDRESMRTEDSSYSSGHISEYNQNSYTTPSVGGSYSADGGYSSGGGGYSSSPAGGNYSGTVGSDGLYTPNTPVNSSVSAVYSSSGGPESENALVAQVRESLRQDPEIAAVAPNIQVGAYQGAIVLNGSCQSEEQKRRILARVQKVVGVVTVNNQLTVMAGPNREDSNGNPLTPTGNRSYSPRLYQDAADGQDVSTNNALNSTSRPNGQTHIYQQNGQNQDTNNIQSNEPLNPTSRENGNSRIYQNNPGEKAQDTNSVPQMP